MARKREIKEVGFSLFSPAEVRAIGIVEIREAKPDLRQSNKEDIQSLYAKSLGPSQNRVQCPTCNLKSPECTGHFGFIEFPERRNGEKIRILHEGFLPMIAALLRCVCKACATPIISENEAKRGGLLRYTGEKRLRKTAELAVKRDSCNCKDGGLTCNYNNPVYVLGKEKGNFIRYHAKDEKKLDLDKMPALTPTEIYEIFRRITPEHLELLGFAPGIRPENMILENILVLPTSTRPPRIIGDKVTHNDLTNLYLDIVRTCNMIRGGLKSDEEEEAIRGLYTLISTLFNNSKGKYHYTNGRPHRTLKCVITGKGRLIRGFTQGKRVNFCIRSVASPNPNLRLSQVGVPRHLAKIVTYPELVDISNRERLQGYVDTGKVNQITRGSGPSKGKVLNVIAMPDKILRIGDTVDRHLMGPRTENGVYIPGDYILVNRQPTLHKMSMMGMEVVIVPENTIQMPVSICAPYGLDFDGDELYVLIGLEQVAATLVVQETKVGKQCNLYSTRSKRVEYNYLVERDMGRFCETA